MRYRKLEQGQEKPLVGDSAFHQNAIMRLLFLFAAVVVLVGGSPPLLAQQGDVRHVHDPVIIREKDTYYVFSTGPGVPMRRSKDLITWENAGRVFAEDTPAWAKAEIFRARDVWAPDISHYNGRFHLYYAVSTMGSQRSVIGLATNATLDPASGDYKWVDHGKVIESFPDKVDYNAIDPNLALDDRGQPWLVFGSFWTGIKMIRLDPRTGMWSREDGKVYPLAARPPNGPIEAPFLIRHNGYYYLFVSFDHCCRGVGSNYKIMVGRSKEITGPYVDFTGRPMLDGGGTLVLAGHGECRGPGHNGILLSKDGDWIVHHMYDAKAGGTPTMQIRPLLWGSDGWPLAGEPIAASPATQRRPHAANILGIWRHSVNFGAEDYFELLPGGRMRAAASDATWKLEGSTLRLRWPQPGAPGGAMIDTCIIAPDGRSYVGRNQHGSVIRGVR